MNPLLKSAGNIGNAALRMGNNYLVPIAEAPVNIGSSILGNLQRDFAPPRTQQLPQGMQSPIPSSQIVPHQQESSWLGMGLDNAQNALLHGMNGITNGIGNQFARLLPNQQTAPPSAIHPIMGHMMQRFTVPVAPKPGLQLQQGNNLPQGLSSVQQAQPAQNVMQRLQKPMQPTENPMPTQTPTGQRGIRQVSQLPTQIPGVTPEVSQNFISNLSQILPVTRQYGIPDALVAGQAAQESGYMQRPAGQYNFFGLKSNSHPGFASFQSLPQAAQYYAQTITSLVPNIQNMSPYQALQALQSGRQRYEGNNPNPMTYVQDVSANPAWQAFGGGR